MAKSQQAVNQTVSGVRVRSKIVPAVTEVRLPHLEHMYRPSPSRQPVGLEFLIRPPLATEPGPGSEMPTVCC